MEFLPAHEWKPLWGVKVPGRIFIDLRRCAHWREAATEIGNVLKGRDSCSLVSGNMDAFIDVVSDGFIERWGERRDVYIRGLGENAALNAGPLRHIAECIDAAFESAAKNEEFHAQACPREEARRRFRIHFCVN
jgi:hypothetical protein